MGSIMNIKEYYGLEYSEYSEEEIYHIYKNTTHWKCLILYVRLCELFNSLPVIMQYIIRFAHKTVYWKSIVINNDIIDMVNKWEI